MGRTKQSTLQPFLWVSLALLKISDDDSHKKALQNGASHNYRENKKLYNINNLFLELRLGKFLQGTGM